MCDDAEEFDRSEENEDAELEERLEGLYRPGAYAEGEELCLEILEDVDPDWEPARLYLLLCLAAQDAEEECLQLIDELEDDSLFEALKHLPFGAGTATEETVYQALIESARARGLDQKLDAFFSTREKPLARQDINSSLSSW